MSVFFVFQLTW